jgi:hypothetical protein
VKLSGESTVPMYFLGVAQSGSARALGARRHRFESCLPDPPCGLSAARSRPGRHRRVAGPLMGPLLPGGRDQVGDTPPQAGPQLPAGLLADAPRLARRGGEGLRRMLIIESASKNGKATSIGRRLRP